MLFHHLERKQKVTELFPPGIRVCWKNYMHICIKHFHSKRTAAVNLNER